MSGISRLSCLEAFWYASLASLVFLTESNNALIEPNCSSSCGHYKEVIVKYPFRFKHDPEGCGMKEYELGCENGRPVLYLGSGRYYVLGINYEKYTIRLIDEGIQKGNYSSLPLHFLTPTILYEQLNVSYDWKGNKPLKATVRAMIANIKCEKQLPVLLDEEVALSIMNVTPSPSNYILFGTLSIYGRNIKVPEGCGIENMHLTFGSSMNWFRRRNDINSSTLFAYFHTQLASGFELGWMYGFCYHYFYDLKKGSYFDHFYYAYCNVWLVWTGYCMPFLKQLIYFMRDYHGRLALEILGMFLGARTFCGLLLLYIYLIYKCRRRHLSVFDAIESFLQTQNDLVPINYSYHEIRTMTKGFKDKLGEGGYGSVYKGKLRSGHDVAIKMLGKSKADGQDFINEVATIGRIHHVNVVKLVGFCAQGTKRALVYDFMPNGSLEKYISSSQEGHSSLSCEQMYSVSLGIARGIEYLHRGCDMQILHFDIKPHNILLDENFTPKISDFGLAKLYPIQNSVVSLSDARGTMGYMAPELFYKNLGGISYKADVYSFGMLLTEMAGRRKNTNAYEQTLSQDYFPSWRCDQLNDEKDLDTRETGVEEVETMEKMMTVALWCLQLNPNDRPPMNKVVEILEGGLEPLQMAPKPFTTPSEMATKDN